MQDYNVKQLGRISMYAKCIGGCMQGDSAGSNPRLCLKKKEKFIRIYKTFTDSFLCCCINTILAVHHRNQLSEDCYMA